MDDLDDLERDLSDLSVRCVKTFLTDGAPQARSYPNTFLVRCVAQGTVRGGDGFVLDVKNAKYMSGGR